MDARRRRAADHLVDRWQGFSNFGPHSASPDDTGPARCARAFRSLGEPAVPAALETHQRPSGPESLPLSGTGFEEVDVFVTGAEPERP